MNDFLEEYLRAAEPDKREKGYSWQTAIGLQKVDGLETSEYLNEVAKKNIEGEITSENAIQLIDSYYKENAKHIPMTTVEADKVSSRIAALLSENTFVFSPAQYISIHKRLFEGIYKFAGTIRDYNITKNEWVLDGDTVLYGGSFELRAALDYDFETERSFKYDNLSVDEVIAHLAKFISRLWQIHIFGEGNTRTTAVFFIKYLRSLGYDVTNDIFANNAWYFRNALVRANYNNHSKGIHETTEYLELFLRNLILKENNPLHNRDLHISDKIHSKQTAEWSSSQDGGQVSGQDKMHSLIEFCSVPRTREEMQAFYGIASRDYFRVNILKPLLESGELRMTIPDKPNSRNQKYIKNNKS